VLLNYLKNSIWYLIGSGIQGLVPVLMTPILTRVLTPELFGEYVLVISIGTVLSFLFALGISASLFREVILGKTPLKEILQSLGPYTIFLLSLAIISFLSSFFLNGYLKLAFLALGLGLSLSMILLKLTIFKATFEARKFAFTAIASTAIPLIIFTIASNFYSNNFLINIYVVFVLILATIINIENVVGYKKDWKLLFYRLLKVGSPTLPHDVGMSLLQYVDRIIIAALFGLTVAGHIHVAALLGTIPYLVLSTLSNVWAPATLEKYKIDHITGTNFLNKTTKIAALGSGLLSLIIILTSETLLKLFSPAAAADPTMNSVIILMSLSGIIYSIYLRNMHLYNLAGRFKSLIWITPTAIATQIFLIYFLSPIYGVLMVAVANLLAISLQAFFTQLMVKRFYPNYILTKFPLYLIIVYSSFIIFYLLY
jgi:O-antigen/teichoic acid export membrane protein